MAVVIGQRPGNPGTLTEEQRLWAEDERRATAEARRDGSSVREAARERTRTMDRLKRLVNEWTLEGSARVVAGHWDVAAVAYGRAADYARRLAELTG